MLQIGKSPAAEVRVSGDTAAPGAISATELLEQLVGFARRQLPLVLFILVLALGAGATYLLTTPPRYAGQAKLIIDSRKVQLFQQQPTLTEVPIDSASVESQLEILQSENVALSVIKDLRLTEDTEFVGSSGGLVGNLLNLASSVVASAPRPQSEFELTRAALASFQSRLSVKRVGLTYVIDISFRSFNPDRAAQIANAVADAYIVDQLDAKYQTTRRAAVWLQDRLQELRQQASAAERAVVDFKAKNNIVDAGGRLMSEQQLAELNSALVQARAQTAEARARLNRIQEITSQVVPDDRFAGTATVAETLKNDVITKLRSQYLELAGREADWSNRYGRNHLAAVNLRNQMHEIRKSILDELKRIAETYKSDFEIAKAREEAVQKSLDAIVSVSQSTSQAQIVLRELESASQSYRALYDNFLQRYMESVQQQSFPITEARVITRASPPAAPSGPKALVVLVMAMGGGLVFGVGLGMLREISDRVFRTASQVESALQTNCISVLPKVKPEVQRSVPDGKIPSDIVGARMLSRNQSLLWHVVNSPLSRFAEGIRTIKVTADMAGAAQSNKVIGITSALPNEGKTLIAISFAQLIADSGARVIVLDCDLRNPSLTRQLAPQASLGLIDVVAGAAALKDAIWTEPSTNLAFLPAVVKSRLAHTSEILASEAMKKLIDHLRESYDYVIVDLSPLAPVVDVRSTVNLIDSYVFVIEWGRTKIEVIEHALGGARAIYDNLLGIVLNKVNLKVLNRYETNRGNYHYNEYYTRYGYSD